jgi:pimeloyl-ACP methyl ester carboxylesterase
MLLAHATGFCGGVWAPLVEAFKTRFRVITLDQRGHGDSDKPDTTYDWHLFVDDLAAVIAYLELEDIVLVGHSKGGAAVAGVAARRPSGVSRVVLIDPVLMPRIVNGARSGHNPLAEGARRRRMVWANRDQIRDSYSRRLPFSTWRPDVLEAYLEHGTFVRRDGQVELKCPGEIEARVYEGAIESGSLEYLSELEMPVLLITGERSTTLSAGLAREAAARLRHGRHVSLPAVGHFIPMEVPDEVIRLVDEFVCADGETARAGGRRLVKGSSVDRTR